MRTPLPPATDIGPPSPQALDCSRLLLERALLPAECAGALGLTFAPGRGVTMTLGTWAVHRERDLVTLVARVVELELTAGRGLVERICRAALRDANERARFSLPDDGEACP